MPKRRRPPKSVGKLEKAFGRVLRENRARQRLTQETLAFESEYHPTYIGQLERGEKSPSLRTIMTLAGVLKTSGSDMLKRVEAESKRS